MTSQTAAATVRQFSAAGPCLTEGTLVRQTPAFFVIRDRHGVERRVGKGLRHVEPCVSCRDHAHTQYPNGYEG